MKVETDSAERLVSHLRKCFDKSKQLVTMPLAENLTIFSQSKPTTWQVLPIDGRLAEVTTDSANHQPSEYAALTDPNTELSSKRLCIV
ncbi:hypothetical protein BaRGS_00006649 [Batillaria attramentaria]|uniref:Uncharacterized protein n=1 Tax=Batillaria attramentaria TaxID=370345 RepID=A0ABD0LRV9_9CAEN